MKKLNPLGVATGTLIVSLIWLTELTNRPADLAESSIATHLYHINTESSVSFDQESAVPAHPFSTATVTRESLPLQIHSEDSPEVRLVALAIEQPFIPLSHDQEVVEQGSERR